MKKIFIGISYILMLVMMFVYLLIPCLGSLESSNAGDVIGSTADTGLSVIGLVFIFPAFVFTIIALCNNQSIHNFLRDVFSLFAGLFILAATIVMIVRDFDNITSGFVPVILIICTVAILIFSIYGVVVGIRREGKEKENSTNNDVKSVEEKKEPEVQDVSTTDVQENKSE